MFKFLKYLTAKPVLRTMRKLTIALVLIASSSVAQKVTYDYDHKVKFDFIKTYVFGGWMEGSDKYINDLDMTRFRQAFTREFSKKGMKYAEDNADIIVTLFVVLDNKTTASNYSRRMDSSGYRASPWGWGGGFSTTTFEEEDYIKGTMVMDIYDAESKLLIWQGVISRTLEGSKDGKARDKKVLETVFLLMENFPPE